ncbi:protein orai-2-like isoform X2 [Latimeria chalumnae]|uniref:protein orai-2-like isoform X2 n=1 Tax=Latimeria chalumnae TaxID=7897 RepID=UPI00313F1456
MNTEGCLSVAGSSPGPSHAEATGKGVDYRDWVKRSYLEVVGSNQFPSQALAWRRLYLSRAKLKASSRTSALLSGFAMVAMAEVQLSTNYTYPHILLIAYSVCTTVLIAIHLFSLLINTCILPSVESVCNIQNLKSVKDSPHEFMHPYIELAWCFSSVLGLLLFLADVVLFYWIKFLPLSAIASNLTDIVYCAPNVLGWQAAVGATVILVPGGIIFAFFTYHLYHLLGKYKKEQHSKKPEELHEKKAIVGSFAISVGMV